ncbi:MAG TPA: alkaline phosphatase family protein [Longimicrobiales bacterium]
MTVFLRCFLLSTLVSWALPLSAQQTRKTQNVIIVTVDGLRWQELFGGVDSALVHDVKFSPLQSGVAQDFWATSPIERRRKLLPFFWDSMAPRAVVLGDRNAGSKVDITNVHRFSYPGYNEILAGYADDARVTSNNKVANPNRTVLEFLHAQPALRGRVAAFTSWDVFPYIINEERSGVPVNAGLEPVAGDLSAAERLLNQLQQQLPNPWPGVRHDALTHNFALEYLRRARPRVLYIGFDETDDFAHEKKYHAYVRAARRTDDMIRELWQFVQSTEGYRNATTLIITTDHGRGDGARFSDHHRDVEGAQHIWIALIGPDTAPISQAAAAGQFYQNQIARTAASLLGYDYTGDTRIGAALTVGTR